jgi:hypothetical protein
MITAAPTGIQGDAALLCRLLAASRAQKTLDTDKSPYTASRDTATNLPFTPVQKAEQAV